MEQVSEKSKSGQHTSIPRKVHKPILEIEEQGISYLPMTCKHMLQKLRLWPQYMPIFETTAGP